MPAPPLILLPGLLCDAALWRAPLRHLLPRVPCLVPSLTEHDTIHHLARHVLSLAPPQFQMAGLSMGGDVAMDVMRQAPQRVTKLALLNTSARPDTDDQLERRSGLISLSQQGKFKGVTPRLLPLLISPAHQNNRLVTRPIMEMAERTGQAAFERQQKAIMSRIDSRPHLPHITIPTLVIGGADDALTPAPITQEIANLIPESRFELLHNCGHLSPLEQPEKVSELMTEWFFAD